MHLDLDEIFLHFEANPQCNVAFVSDVHCTRANLADKKILQLYAYKREKKSKQPNVRDRNKGPISASAEISTHLAGMRFQLGFLNIEGLGETKLAVARGASH